MKVFKPPKIILEKIVTEPDNEKQLICNYTPFYEILKRGTPIQEKTIVVGVAGSIAPKMDAFYFLSSAKKKYREKKEKIINRIVSVAGEAMKNCYDHALKNKDILFGLFLGNEGVCYGFQDGGDYFKNEKIKYQWENRIEIEEFDIRTKGNNLNQGANVFIFPYTDFIHVDSTKGILYLVCLMDSEL